MSDSRFTSRTLRIMDLAVAFFAGIAFTLICFTFSEDNQQRIESPNGQLQKAEE